MIVKYVGPSTVGLCQVGTFPVEVPFDTPVELPDDLAELVLAQAPAHWELVGDGRPKRKKKSGGAAAATTPDPAADEAVSLEDDPE